MASLQKSVGQWDYFLYKYSYNHPHIFSLYLSVIVTAVEIMLDKFDRKISDRFKIIGYKDDDNAKLVSSLPNHISNVAVPVALGRWWTHFTSLEVMLVIVLLFPGLAAFIMVCFCCTRDISPMCKLCKSKIWKISLNLEFAEKFRIQKYALKSDIPLFIFIKNIVGICFQKISITLYVSSRWVITSSWNPNHIDCIWG